MATWTYLDWIGQNLRWGAGRLAPGRRGLPRRFSWRGLFGRRSGERVAPTRITGEAVGTLRSVPQARHHFRTSADTQARIERMRRAAVLDMFDQVGLAPLPGQLWRFVDGERDPGAGVTAFLRAIGIDADRIVARDTREIGRANEVLELLFSIDHVFDRIEPTLAAQLEARLCSGDYGTVRVAARVVNTFETIARMESRWPVEARLGVLDRFIGDVRSGLTNPLAVQGRDAAAADASAEVLMRQMVAFDAECQELRRLAHELTLRWPRPWVIGPEADVRRSATRAAERAQLQLIRGQHLRQDEVDRFLGQLAHANAALAGLLDRINGTARHGHHHPGGDAGQPGQRRAPHSEFDRALTFFGFAAGARPDQAALRTRFRELARTMHPDLAQTGPAAQQAAHAKFIELNHYYELLKLRL